MAVFETWLKADLKKQAAVEQLRGVLFSGDAGANKIGVIVTDGGETASLTGTVTGYIIRPDGETIPVTGAIEQGNRVYIILPAEAYEVTGYIRITIKIAADSAVVTLCTCIAYIYQTTTTTQTEE